MDPISDAISFHQSHPSVLKIRSDLVSSNESFEFKNTSLDEVLTEITNLKSNCSMGFDGIPSKTLKLCAVERAPFLVECFHGSIVKCTYPHNLKHANMVPVPKSGNPLSKSNYRQVSILPVVSKIFERIILKQLNTYFKDKLSPLLGGYKKGFSCQHSLLRLLEKWRVCLDKKGITGTILIDLSKAFDLIDHKLLIAKLAAYGLGKSSLKFILSYLRGRKQRVKINNFFSD